MDNTFIVDIGKLAVVRANNATRNFSAASFTSNTMSGNIINISIHLRSQNTKFMFFVDTDNTSQIRCILICRQTSSCHRTVALNIINITDFRFKITPVKSTAINACNAACYSIRPGDNCTLVIAVSNTAVVFAYKATDITAATFYGIAIAGNAADFATIIFCCYSANTVISIITGEYGRSDVHVFDYRTTAQLAKKAAISLQADNRMTITVKRAPKGFIATANSVIGALAFCIHQAAGIYIIFQDIIIA